MKKAFCIMVGHTVYSLQPWKDPWGRKTPFRYQGFCDGSPCGLFKTKKDFEDFVRVTPPEPIATHEQAVASRAAEAHSVLHGNTLLRKFQEGGERS